MFTQFLLNFSVLCCYWKWLFIPFRTMFQCFNVASIGPEISFRSFDVSHRRRWGGDTIILTPSSYSFFVFFVSTKNYDLYHLFQCFNVASIGPSLSFWSFDVSCIGQYECDIAHQSMYIQQLSSKFTNQMCLLPFTPSHTEITCGSGPLLCMAVMSLNLSLYF